MILSSVRVSIFHCQGSGSNFIVANNVVMSEGSTFNPIPYRLTDFVGVAINVVDANSNAVFTNNVIVGSNQGGGTVISGSAYFSFFLLLIVFLIKLCRFLRCTGLISSALISWTLLVSISVLLAVFLGQTKRPRPIVLLVFLPHFDCPHLSDLTFS